MRVRFTRDWAKWVGISDIGKAPCAPGAYVIAAESPIQRIVGIDKHGLLSIGESENLQKRLHLFHMCAKGERHRGHNAGWRYHELNMIDRFPLASLRFRWCATDDKVGAYLLEGSMLKLYVSDHFELPPLNYKYNWSAHILGN